MALLVITVGTQACTAAVAAIGINCMAFCSVLFSFSLSFCLIFIHLTFQPAFIGPCFLNRNYAKIQNLFFSKIFCLGNTQELKKSEKKNKQKTDKWPSYFVLFKFLINGNMYICVYMSMHVYFYVCIYTQTRLSYVYTHHSSVLYKYHCITKYTLSFA